MKSLTLLIWMRRKWEDFWIRSKVSGTWKAGEFSCGRKGSSMRRWISSSWEIRSCSVSYMCLKIRLSCWASPSSRWSLPPHCIKYNSQTLLRPLTLTHTLLLPNKSQTLTVSHVTSKSILRFWPQSHSPSFSGSCSAILLTEELYWLLEFISCFGTKASNDQLSRCSVT